jgi:hypothetical protein
MQLLNLSFAILIFKVAFCVLPGVLGIYFISMPEDSRHSLWDTFCQRLFGMRNAIAYSSFARCLNIIATLLLILSLVATWFLLLRRFFGA